jgi:FHS family L-fucose permease-like MFS transporter
MEQTSTPVGARAPGVLATAAGAATWLLPFVVMLFFAWGFATVMIDTLIPKLKGLFALNYAQAMLTQFAFFIAYFAISAPAGMLLSRIGYMRGIVAGLVVMALGCLMFSPAASAGVYWGFLAALFIMAAGITTLQVAANPLIAILGPPGKSHFRLNLAQAFNSLGTFIGPFIGAAVILKSGVTPPDPKTTAPAVLETYRISEAHAVQAPFLGIAVGLVALAVIFWLFRNNSAVPTAARNETGLSSFKLLGRPRLGLGVLAIFLYVGAEVAIGSLMVNYLLQPKILSHTAGVACHPVGFDLLRLFYPCLHTAQDAGKMVSFYWGAAMVGRLIGSGVLFLRFPAGRLLSLCAVGAGLLVAISAASVGWTAVAAIIAVGLFNSIMFPTIFTLGIEGMGPQTPQASSLLCMAIVGGAIIPFITGAVADHTGLSLAFAVPVACYALIALYGQFSHSRQVSGDAPVLGVP